MHPPNGIASIACSASRPEPTAASLPSLCGFVDFSFKSTVTLRRPLRSDTHRPRLRTGLSRQANPSLSVGTKSAGNAFARARDRAAFCTRKPPSPAAETGNASPASAKVAEHRGLFKRPQEIVFVQDCVVEVAGLGLRACRLWPSNRSLYEALWPFFIESRTSGMGRKKIRQSTSNFRFWHVGIVRSDEQCSSSQACGGSTENRSSDSVTRYPRAE
jgi:hypothetical protein